MSKFIFNVKIDSSKTAGSKAKEDVVNILKNNNFKVIEITASNRNIFKYFCNFMFLKNMNKNIKPNDLIVYQYPEYSKLIKNHVMHLINKNLGIKSCIIIHDINSLRSVEKVGEKEELDFFNRFDKIIAHNQKMMDWLIMKGIKSDKLINLEIFDYLDTNECQNKKREYPLIFAGNLAKSTFLSKWKYNTKVNLFGINPNLPYPGVIRYQGAYDANELIGKLEGNFGLVWDGDSLQRCSGITGEYMKFNNPHKVSLYISAGIPIIIWKEAALSEFVESNKIGFTVDSLDEIDQILSEITDQEYLDLIKNTIKIKKLLKSGHYTLAAISKIK